MHTKNKYGGVIIAATALDGQNYVYPLAVMFCKSETEANWYIFLKEIKQFLFDTPGLTFISDRQKDLLESVRKLFPFANHRYCLRHLYQNYIDHGCKGPKLRDLLLNAAKAYKKSHWKVQYLSY